MFAVRSRNVKTHVDIWLEEYAYEPAVVIVQGPELTLLDIFPAPAPPLYGT